MAKPRVLLTTEGTYPFHLGGVSTWCDALVHQLPDVDFIIMAIAMNPYVAVQFDLPPNVQKTVAVPLWGMQDPSEYRNELAYSEIFLQKQRTGHSDIQDLFLPHLERFLKGLVDERSGEIGSALAQMYRFFRTFDYQTTFKSEDVWELYKSWLLSAARDGYWSEPSIFESVQGLGWIYHFLTILNTAIPDADMVHSSAAAFCGMVGIVAKMEYGTPYLLTEHGVYLREQYLAIGRSNMTPFSKRFLISLVKAISRENLYFADALVPVCAFNGRWERVLGADARKIRVIYNGVSSRVFHPPATPRNTSEEAPVEVLSVARIDPNKDLETLLHAIHLVKSFHIPVQLRVLGSVSVESYHQKVLALTRELGLEDMVNFEGHHPDISDAYRRADIVVQSSVTEAFPYSVIESMMSGVPMVATDVGGTREALGNAGILVPSRNPAQLAAGIAMLAKDAELRRRLGKAARQRALEYFEISKAMKAFWDLYHQWQSGKLAEPDVVDLADPALIHVTRGLLLRRLQQTQMALDEYRSALKLLGNHPAAVPLLAEIASLELGQGQTDEAYTHLLKSRVLQAVFRQNSSKVS